MAQPDNRYVGTRITPAQYATVHTNCADAGTTVSAVLRDLLERDGWFTARDPGNEPA